MQHRRIRALIVDDEPLARSNLKLLLRRDADVESIGECGECGGGAEALAQIRAARPELVFLDVQMPECGGFEVLKIFKAESILPVVVFVTAYDEYALRAFDAGALDYLLKPFDDARFGLAMQRAKANLAARHVQENSQLTVRAAGRLIYVPTEDVHWVEAADYYVCLHLGARTHLLRQSLAELEQRLDPRLFGRIHRSTIVNLARVRALKIDAAGEHQVLLEGGQSLRVSRRYNKQLQSRMQEIAAAPARPQNAAG